MLEFNLPLPKNEAQFWQQVACRWVKSAGLLVAVVPTDQNDFTIGRWVRDYACHPPASDTLIKEFRPSRSDTYCYDLSVMSQPAEVSGSELLPRVLNEIDEHERVQMASRGELSFYLLLTGLTISRGTSISNWIRKVVETWPGIRPAAPLAQFYVCCIVSTSLPKHQGTLPEGCDWITPACENEAEIIPIVENVVGEYWEQENFYTRQYICLGLADMASGRRKHAELALELLLQEKKQKRTKKDTMGQLQWPFNSASVQQARELLAQESLDLNWMQSRKARLDINEAEITGQLWAHGLWHHRLENGGIWPGLTSLAKAAIRPSASEDWLVPLSLAHATMLVLNRCMQIEQQLKHLLWYFLESNRGRGRERLRQILDATDGQFSALSMRDRIAAKITEQQSRIPAHKIRCDETIISISSFGNLKEILFSLLQPDKHHTLIKAVNTLVWARNIAAHGRWFTLSDYVRICEQADEAEIELSHLRI